MVICSRRPLCCGRPLYDFGMLEKAKNNLRQIMSALGPRIDAGLPIVVLEPSCASVFRDELRNLFPTDERANRLRSQTFLLSEFLQDYAPNYPSSKSSMKVLLHGHCHQKALMKMDHEEALLRMLGAELQSPDSGCCGMAGPFGFHKDKFEVSQAVAERVLLPAVRNAAPDIIIQPTPGQIYVDAGSTFIAEHGGNASTDRNVPLLIVHPKFSRLEIKFPVQTSQIAPSILKALGLNPDDLDAVRIERTPELPGLDLDQFR